MTVFFTDSSNREPKEADIARIFRGPGLLVPLKLNLKKLRQNLPLLKLGEEIGNKEWLKERGLIEEKAREEKVPEDRGVAPAIDDDASSASAFFSFTNGV